MSRPVVVGVIAIVVGGAGASASSGDIWKTLRRPLHLPKVAPGARCPVSARSRVDLGANGVRMLPGGGPAYPNFGKPSVLEFYWPPLETQTDFYRTGWSGNKVLWWVTGAYTGPVLIRGRRLDGPERVRFELGSPPPLELRIHAGKGTRYTKGARDRPSYTRVRAPGCYAYQIDGTSFSRAIVFAARMIPPPPDDWTKLRRPLSLPTVASGTPCPVSGRDETFDFGKYGVSRGIGSGPAWPIGFAQPGSVLTFQYPPPSTSGFAGSDWGGQKVLWFVSPDAVGPVLVRGRRLDGPEELRFGDGKMPSTELHLVKRLDNPSYTRLRASGCYGYQVDGTSFSYSVVFRAERST